MATVTRSSARNSLQGVPFDVYERLRDHPSNGGLRMTYHDGTLELTSPAYRHEQGSERISLIIRAYVATFQIPCRGTRTTTFRKGVPGSTLGQGKEPDLSYYFANAPMIRSNRSIDLTIDPPPDLWVEVDHRASSAGRLPVYAALGIPEVWRYRAYKKTLWFGVLDGDSYREVDRSRSLERLSPSIVLDLLAEADRLGETEWDIWMRHGMDGTLREADL